jgi:colicin import membrane protein
MDSKKSFLASFTVHLVILGLLTINVAFTPSKKKSDFAPPASVDKPIIQAGVVSKNLVENAVKRQQQEEQQRKTDLQKQQQQIQQAKKEAEQQKLQAKTLADQAKKIQQDALKAQELAKKQEKEISQKKQELAKQQQRVQQEQLRLKQLAEQKQQQDLKQAQQAQQAAAAASAASASARASEVERYRSMIGQRIKANRTLSSAFDSNLVCLIHFRLLPDGSVHSFRIAKSSGNPAYDQSAETAVYKSSPFEMPEDPELIAYLREFNMNFKVE